ncbi:MAG: hypothetical protein M0Q13_14860 [Methanothrix sp.]|jgi:7-cyano-7-deazaguanine tRNA-ribosyltransferase|nr:hypothetical protein [Methanothrix sp.]
MLDGLKRPDDQGQWLESLDSASKSTFFYLSPECASRPEVVRYARRIDRISLPGNVLITHDSQADTSGFAHVLHFQPPFGPYPVELSETYPFNAEVPEEADDAAMKQALKITKELIRANPGAKFRFRLKNRELEELLKQEQTITGAIQGG